MSNNSIENNIIDAISTIVDNAVSKANYDKTIIASVTECVNDGIGQYKVKYQDSIFNAYATDGSTYLVGANVYVLIPNNDFTSSKKVILGESTKNSILSVDVNEVNENDYTVYGGNILKYTESSVFSIDNSNTNIIEDSDGTEYHCLVLYSKGETDNTISIDESKFNTYKSKCDSILTSVKIRNSISADDRETCKYWFIIGISFYINEDQNNTITKYFEFNSENVSGNPYNMVNFTKQLEIYENNPTKIYEIESIALCIRGCNNDFSLDITEPVIKFAQSIDDDDKKGNYLNFVLPDGNVLSSDQKTISVEARPRIDGKVAKLDANKNIFYYWFVEDASITYTSDKYVTSYGGIGWRCLNKKNNLGVFESLEKKYKFTSEESSEDNCLKIGNAVAYIKCALIYDDNVLINTLKIQNSCNDASNYYITTTSGVTNFHNEDIYIDLFLYDDKDIEPKKTNVTWIKEDKSGNNFIYSELEDVAETDDIDSIKEIYGTEKTEDQNIKDYIAAAEAYINEEKSKKNITIDTYTDLVDKYNKLYVIKEKYNTTPYILNGALRNIKVGGYGGIDTYNIFKACVEGSDSARQIITNATEGENLIINNGDQNFMYTYSGISPASTSLENPQVVLPLSFTYTDDNGNVYTEDTASDLWNSFDVTWKIPKNDTFLLPTDSNKDSLDSDDDFYYSKDTSLSFKIADSYSDNYSNNQIELSIKYNNDVITTATNFSFLRNGTIGTNGGAYSSVITWSPREVSENNFPQNRFMLITNKSGSLIDEIETTWYKYGIKKGDASKDSPDGITYTIFYSSDSDCSKFKYTEDTSGNKIDILQLEKDDNKKQSNINFFQSKITFTTTDDNSADTDKDSAENKVYSTTQNTLFTVQPIAYCEYKDLDKSDITFTINNGLKYVMYDSGGNNPIYDIDNKYDISYSGNNENDDIQLTFESLIKDVDKEELYNKELEVEKYTGVVTSVPKKIDGLQNDACIKCTVHLKQEKDTEYSDYAYIYLPIYLYISKNDLPLINGWDGNSLKIDEDNGNILAPQIGAGLMNENKFTGIVIGTERKNYKSNASKSETHTSTLTGLFAYNAGQRSAFIDSETGSAVFGIGNKGGRIAIDASNSNDLEIYSSNYFTSNAYNDKDLVPKKITNIAEHLCYYEDSTGYYCRSDIKNIENKDCYYYINTIDSKKDAGTQISDGKNDYIKIRDELRYELVKDDFGNITYRQSDKGSYIYIYDSDVYNNEGMMIDLPDSYIRWGNGNFSVDASGTLNATGGGTVGGWLLEKYTLRNAIPKISSPQFYVLNDYNISDTDTTTSTIGAKDDNENVKATTADTKEELFEENNNIIESETSIQINGNPQFCVILITESGNCFIASKEDKDNFEISYMKDSSKQTKKSQYMLYYLDTNNNSNIIEKTNGKWQCINSVITFEVFKSIKAKQLTWDDGKGYYTYGDEKELYEYSSDLDKFSFNYVDEDKIKEIGQYITVIFNNSQATVGTNKATYSYISFKGYQNITTPLRVNHHIESDVINIKNKNEDTVFQITPSGKLIGNQLIINDSVKSFNRDYTRDEKDGFILTPKAFSIRGYSEKNDNHIYRALNNTQASITAIPPVYLYGGKGFSRLYALSVGAGDSKSVGKSIVKLDKDGNVWSSGWVRAGSGFINNGTVFTNHKWSVGGGTVRVLSNAEPSSTSPTVSWATDGIKFNGNIYSEGKFSLQLDADTIFTKIKSTEAWSNFKKDIIAKAKAAGKKAGASSAKGSDF